MSGISGGHRRDFTPEQERYYADLVERVRAEEKTAAKTEISKAGARRKPRMARVGLRAALADRQDVDA